MRTVKLWGAIFAALTLFMIGFLLSLVVLSGCVRQLERAPASIVPEYHTSK